MLPQRNYNYNRNRNTRRVILISYQCGTMKKLLNTVLCLFLSIPLYAHADTASYQINPGDILLVSIWNEKDLSQEILVRPDGKFSFPLAGEIQAGGHAVAEIENSLTEALTRFMNDKPAVTVAIKDTRGYNIYVIGKVNKPGQFPINQPTDVMQALAMAGGLNSFAAESNIHILRRDKNGVQEAIRFRYSDVKTGDELQTNIRLQSGDVVVVP